MKLNLHLVARLVQVICLCFLFDLSEALASTDLVSGVSSVQRLSNGAMVIKGYVCSDSTSMAPQVVFYLGGSREYFNEQVRHNSDPLYTKAPRYRSPFAIAHLLSGAVITARCGSPNNNFRIEVPSDKAEEFAGRTMYGYIFYKNKYQLFEKTSHVPGAIEIDVEKRLHKTIGSGASATAELRQLIDEALQLSVSTEKSVELKFGDKEYNLSCPEQVIQLGHSCQMNIPQEKQFSACLRLSSEDNQSYSKARLIFSGHPTKKAKISLMESSAGFLSSDGIDSLSVNNFKIKHKVLPFVQGDIQEVNLTGGGKGSFVWQLDSGFPALSPEMVSCFGQSSPNLGYLRPYGFSLLPNGDIPFQEEVTQNLNNLMVKPTSCEALSQSSPFRYRCHLKEQDWGQVAVGMKFFSNSSPTLRTFSSSNGRGLSYNNILINSGGLAFAIGGIDNYIEFSTVRIQPEKSTHVASVNYGGVNINVSRAPVRYEFNKFSSLFDDAINIHSRLMPVEKIVPNGEVFVRRIPILKPVPGDTVQIIDRVTKSLIEKVFISGVRKTTCKIVKLGMVPCYGLEIPFVFDPSRPVADYALSNISEGSPFSVVRASFFGRNNARKVLIKGYGQTIRDNLFHKIGAQGVLAKIIMEGSYSDPTLNKSGLFDAPLPENLLIQGNFFHGGIFRKSYPLEVNFKGSYVANNPIYQMSGPQEIDVRDNKFCGWRPMNQDSMDPVFSKNEYAFSALSQNAKDTCANLDLSGFIQELNSLIAI